MLSIVIIFVLVNVYNYLVFNMCHFLL